MPNADRLTGTLNFIKAHPEKHNQVTWIGVVDSRTTPDPDPINGCGTVACFAGWASLLYGPESGWTPVRLGSEFFQREGGPHAKHARHLAPVLLGLDEDQADYLFSASRTLEQLETAVGEIIDGTFVAPDEEEYDDEWDEDYEVEEDDDA